MLTSDKGLAICLDRKGRQAGGTPPRQAPTIPALGGGTSANIACTRFANNANMNRNSSLDLARYTHIFSAVQKGPTSLITAVLPKLQKGPNRPQGTTVTPHKYQRTTNVPEATGWQPCHNDSLTISTRTKPSRELKHLALVPRQWGRRYGDETI